MLRRGLVARRGGTVVSAIAMLVASSGCASRGNADRSEGAEPSEVVSPSAIGGVERLRAVPAVRERLDRGLPLVATERGFRSPTKEVSPIGHWRPAGGRPEVTLPRTAAAPTRLAFAGDPDLWIEVASAGDRDVAAEVVHETLVHRGTSDDVDVFRILQPHGAEEFRWLGSSRAARRFEYRVTHGPGVERLQVTAGAVEAVDRSGTVRFKMERPWSIDARGVRGDVEVTLTGARDAWRVAVAVDHAAAFPVALDPSWAVVTSMAKARFQQSAVLLGDGTVLVFGGDSPASAERYDPVADKWTTLPKPPDSGFEWHSAVTLLDGSVLFVVNLASYRFYPSSNTWSVAVNGLSLNSVPPVAVLVGSGKVLAADPEYSNAEIYDPSKDIWTSAHNLAGSGQNGQYLFVRLPDGRALATDVSSAAANIYDPTSNTWSNTGSLVGTQYGGSLTLLSTGQVLYVHGKSEIYDPVSNTWKATLPSMSSHSTKLAFKLSGGRVLVPPDGTSPGEVFDPATNGWSAAGLLSAPSLEQGGTLLTSGRVLIAGGLATGSLADGGTTNYTVSATDVFDPATALWTFGGALSDSRYYHSTTLLSSGKVLVAGGYIRSPTNTGRLSSAEVFTPLALPLGASCTAAGECVSTFCIDGVCCGAACNGTCQACAAAKKSSGANGTCGPAAVGLDPHESCKDDGSPTCSNNGLCDGAGACQKYPASSACAPSPCTKASDCTSGFCSDGVCCDTKCDGTCLACTKALKGTGFDGVCGPAAAATDPHGQCTTDPGFPANCHADGLCDGAGACHTFAPAATICGTPTCAAGVQKTPTCDGAGVCNLGSTSCAPFACDAAGTVCAKTCALDADCGAGAYCDTGTCKPKKTNGDAASASSQCQSGIVADGVCCNDTCTGLCEACDAGTTKGTCTAVVGSAKHGSCPAATGGDPCSGGACDGKTRTSCAGLPGPSIICQPGSCGDGLEVPQGLCDGSGVCQAPKARKCDPYVCGAKACLSACTTAADCVAGSRCDAASGKCVANGSCSADLTTATAPTGEVTKCYPVLCIPSKGSCGETCQSAADCASPFVCDAQGHCVNPPSLTSGSGGCSVTWHSDASGRAVAAGALAGLLLLGIGSRRRRATRGRAPSRLP
jgi:hypothetical protein